MYRRIFLLSLIVISQCHGKSRGKCDCGTFQTSLINSRIWNGNNATKLRYPWYIHIKEYKESDPGTASASGGTLISKKHVLTCAHCVKHIIKDP